MIGKFHSVEENFFLRDELTQLRMWREMENYL